MNDKRERNVSNRTTMKQSDQELRNSYRHTDYKKRKKKKNYKYIKYKIYAFSVMLGLITFISVFGRLFPSANENKENAKFPSFDFVTFANGEYFRGISEWFCDTFPMSHKFSQTGRKETKNVSQDNNLETGKVLFGEKTFKQHGLQMIRIPDKDRRAETLMAAMEQELVTDPKTPMVALTFDDGPSKYTDRLLDILVENDAKATFYIVGSRIQYFPDTVKRMAELDMEYGNHTYEHKYLSSLEGEDEYWQLEKVDAELRELSGKETKSIRPPGGRMDDVPSEYIDKPLLLWSVDTMDWDSRNAEAVAEHIRTHVYDGAVILMHDLYESTVDAMAIIIPELKALGYELVTISELAEVKGYTLEAGKAYTDFTLIESEESSNGQ